MQLPTNKVEGLRLLKRTAIGAFALVLRTIILGNVVRLRAQYVPDVVQLDSEDGKDVMGISYMRMLKRVIRLEGWKGLLRGILPLVVATVFTVSWHLVSHRRTMVHFNSIPDAIVRYCILVLFDVPFTIFFVRSITTPEMLPFFGIRRAVHTLLSPAERHKPWLLYPPSLLLIIALERAWDTLLISVLTKLISRHIPEAWFVVGMTMQTLARLSLVFFHVAVFGPLEVIQVRLAVQRHKQPIMLPEGRHDASDSGTDNVTDGAEPLEAVTANVVRLRTDSEQPAYTGLFNCVHSVIAEEGFETFYRAWWYTLLVAIIKVRIIQC